jgi:hypothetical protein
MVTTIGTKLGNDVTGKGGPFSLPSKLRVVITLDMVNVLPQMHWGGIIISKTEVFYICVWHAAFGIRPACSCYWGGSCLKRILKKKGGGAGRMPKAACRMPHICGTPLFYLITSFISFFSGRY